MGRDEGKIAFTSHDTLLKKEVLRKGFQIAEDAENYSKIISFYSQVLL